MSEREIPDLLAALQKSVTAAKTSRGVETMSGHRHWLMFNEGREIVGCHCGFAADVEGDDGYGDSVVDHLLTMPRGDGLDASPTTIGPQDER